MWRSLDLDDKAARCALSAEAFQRRPFATCYINVTDGLRANQEALQKCMFLAGKGLPQLYIPLGDGPHSQAPHSSRNRAPPRDERPAPQPGPTLIAEPTVGSAGGGQ